MSVIDRALRLAAQNVAVFPCLQTKAPSTPHGFKDATADVEGVRALFARYPGPLLGVPTGEVNRFSALDIDPKNDGMVWLSEHRHRLPPTRWHETKSGGAHLLFRHRPGMRNSASRISAGVDIRGSGGYVIWWPAAGYPVVNPNVIADFPSWLADLASPPAPALRVAPPVEIPTDRVIAGIIRVVQMAQEGTRNKLVFWGAVRLGELSRSDHLTEANAIALARQAGIDAGLPAIEAEKTAASGVATGRSA